MEQPLSVFERLQATHKQAADAAAQSEQTYQNTLGQFTQYHQEYADGRRNPVADLIRKPERDQAAEKRYKQAATIGLMGDALGLIGKSYAASKGVQPSKTEGTTTFQALGELKKLDDIYRQEGVRYDHNRLLDALRRKEASDQIQQVNLREAGSQRAVAAARLQKANEQLADYQSAQAKAAQDRAKSELEWQRTQQRDDQRYRRDITLRNISAGGGRGNGLPTGQVALVARGPNGKMENVYTGQYSLILDRLKQENPNLQVQLDNTNLPTQSREKIEQAAVSKYVAEHGLKMKFPASVSKEQEMNYGIIDRAAQSIVNNKNLTTEQQIAVLGSVLGRFPEEVAGVWVNNNYGDYVEL